MKVYLNVDIEGISGIFNWKQTNDKCEWAYQEARCLMMKDIDAAIEGCLSAGADEIVVRDGHHGGRNAIPELMHPKASYICGYASGLPVFPELAGSAAMLCIGFHSKWGTPDGVLNHTQSRAGERRYFYNGVECGELAQHSLTAGHYGVPVPLVEGDAALCREAKELLGNNIFTVCTKTGYAEEYAKLTPPAVIREQLREAAEQAVRQADRFQPFQMEFPIHGRLVFPDKERADTYAVKSDQTRRVDDTSFERDFDLASDILLF